MKTALCMLVAAVIYTLLFKGSWELGKWAARWEHKHPGRTWWKFWVPKPACKKACSTCAYRRHMGVNFCVRNAPKIYDPARGREWPKVYDGDWCGEWQRNTDPQAE